MKRVGSKMGLCKREVGARGKPRHSSALARCKDRRHAGEVRAWKQSPNLDRGWTGMNEWWCDECGNNNNGLDGCNTTIHVSANKRRGLSLHARRPQQRNRVAKKNVVQRSTCFPSAEAHLCSCFFKSIFSPTKAVFNSTVIGPFVCLPYEALLEPAGSLTKYIHTYIHIYKSVLWRSNKYRSLARCFAKGKPLKLGIYVCVWKPYTVVC